MKKAIKSLRASIPSQRRLKQPLPNADDAGNITPVAIIQQTLDVEGSDPVIPATTIEPTSAIAHSNPTAPLHGTGTSDVYPASLGVENEEQIDDSEEGNPSTNSLIRSEETPSVTNTPAMLALIEATQEFQRNYQLFAKKNQLVLPVPAFEELVDQKNRNASSLSLKDVISATLIKIETNKNVSKTKWPTRLGTFMTKCYPLFKTGVNLTKAAADVSLIKNNIDVKGTGFLPLKGAIGGLAVILQVSPPQIVY